MAASVEGQTHPFGGHRFDGVGVELDAVALVEGLAVDGPGGGVVGRRGSGVGEPRWARKAMDESTVMAASTSTMSTAAGKSSRALPRSLLARSPSATVAPDGG